MVLQFKQEKLFYLKPPMVELVEERPLGYEFLVHIHPMHLQFEQENPINEQSKLPKEVQEEERPLG